MLPIGLGPAVDLRPAGDRVRGSGTCDRRTFRDRANEESLSAPVSAWIAKTPTMNSSRKEGNIQIFGLSTRFIDPCGWG